MNNDYFLEYDNPKEYARRERRKEIINAIGEFVSGVVLFLFLILTTMFLFSL